MNIFEASITRILRDIESEEQFAIITAWRNVGTGINKSNVNTMIQDIKSNGLSFIKIIGFGQEEGGRVSKEPSLIVKNKGYGGKTVLSPKEFDRYIINLGVAFDQYGIVLKNKDGKIQLIFLKNDQGHKIVPKVAQTFTKIKVDKIATFYSKLKGHSFVFEYFHPDWSKLENYLHGMAKESLWKKELQEIINNA